MDENARSGRPASGASTSAVMFAFLGAIIGAGVVLFMKTGTYKPNMAYADLAATLLAAVGVIVAIFAGVLAIAALWGFDQMKKEAMKSATGAALEHLKEQIENGSLRTYIYAEIERLIAEEFNSRRMDRRIQERVDKIAMGGSEDRLLDEPEEDGV